MRKVRILSIPGPDQPEAKPQEMGQMIDDGGEPFGTTPLANEMLERDPRERFEYYHKGWSNAYIETKAA